MEKSLKSLKDDEMQLEQPAYTSEGMGERIVKKKSINKL